MLDLGDHEQEEAWGERVMVDGQECRGVFAVCKVQTSLRVRRKALKGVPAAGRKVVAVRSGRAFRIARVRDWAGDVALVLELSEV